MKVVLLKDVKKIGRKGDIKNVSDGYGRNFLIPKKMATLATNSVIDEIEEEKQHQEEEAEQELLAFQDLAARLDGLEIEIPAKASQDGKLFGSINEAKLVEFLSLQGHDLKKEYIKLEAPIKEIGEYDIILELPHGLEAKIKIIVVAIEDKK